MYWTAREKLVLTGASLAIIPALAFLPTLAWLVITPAFSRSTVLACIVFPSLAVGEILGIVRLVRCCVTQPFDLLTAFAFSALLVVVVIATYTGVFLAALASAM